MPGNLFGKIFQVTTFGESHGEMIGVIIDGCPSGLRIDLKFIQAELHRRKPAQSSLTTQRNESDQVRFVSGVFKGKTTGAPITAFIVNQDARPKDYARLSAALRPSHADFTYEQKYGHRDPRGGGRSSARETAARVIAGAVAKLILRRWGIKIQAYVSAVGPLTLETPAGQLNLAKAERNKVRCPDPLMARKMIALIEEMRNEGDTVGGVVSCRITGCPVGLGEPVFDRLHADLGKAMLSINAVKGFDYGSGFAGSKTRGSTHNDPFVRRSGRIQTLTNHSGGIQGGISNGMEIDFRVAFKPVSTLMKNLKAIGVRGRHDPCVVPRAVPIVEAMAALVLIDHLLRNQTAKLGHLKI